MLKQRAEIKIRALFFKEIVKWILKLIRKYNRSPRAKSNLTKKNRSNFKTYYKATMIKTV